MKTRKIRFIKGNDLFDFKVGDVAFFDEDVRISWSGHGEFCEHLNVRNLTRLGYAEYVREDRDWNKFLEEKKTEFLEGWGWGGHAL